MAFKITGKIEVIGTTIPIASKSGTTYYKRELVLDSTRYSPETGEPWENHPKFEFSGVNCSVLDSFSVGQKVSVDFGLRGVKYTDKATGEIKYFTSINAFRIELAEEQISHTAQQHYVPTPSQASPGLPTSEQASNPHDLPF